MHKWKGSKRNSEDARSCSKQYGVWEVSEEESAGKVEEVEISSSTIKGKRLEDGSETRTSINVDQETGSQDGSGRDVDVKKILKNE